VLKKNGFANNGNNGCLKRRQKIPFKKRPLKNNGKQPLPKDVIKQNFLRRDFSRKIQGIKQLMPIRTIDTGVDYNYSFMQNGQQHKVTLDMKFSFGRLGENTICARIDRNRKVINEAGWVMAFNRRGEIEVFKTKALIEYVSRSWGGIDKSQIKHEAKYDLLPIKLELLYEFAGIKPMVFSGTRESIRQMLSKIKSFYAVDKPKNNTRISSKIKKNTTKPSSTRKPDMRMEQRAKGALARKHLPRTK
jgi:hypothetical protein